MSGATEAPRGTIFFFSFIFSRNNWILTLDVTKKENNNTKGTDYFGSDLYITDERKSVRASRERRLLEINMAEEHAIFFSSFYFFDGFFHFILLFFGCVVPNFFKWKKQPRIVGYVWNIPQKI